MVLMTEIKRFEQLLGYNFNSKRRKTLGVPVKYIKTIFGQDVEDEIKGSVLLYLEIFDHINYVFVL